MIYKLIIVKDIFKLNTKITLKIKFIKKYRKRILIFLHNSIHRFLHGLLGSLIPIDTHAFVPQRQSSIVTRFRHFATSYVSKYFNTLPRVSVTPLDSSSVISFSLLGVIKKDLLYRLRTL